MLMERSQWKETYLGEGEDLCSEEQGSRDGRTPDALREGALAGDRLSAVWKQGQRDLSGTEAGNSGYFISGGFSCTWINR